MSVKITAPTLVLVIVLGFAVAAPAEPWRGWKGSGGWGVGSQYLKLYDVKSLESVNGTVDSIETFSPIRGMSLGVLVNLKTDDGTIAVHLGPVWYIERQDVKFDKGDTVELKGAKLTFDGSLVIIASEIKKGDDTLNLRDESGAPRWVGSDIAGQAR
ncbi:MAG: DNA-binding protein [Nitrospirota bacterium]